MAAEEKDIAIGRSISLRLSEWRELARRDATGSATREAARIVREHLKKEREGGKA